MSWKIGNNYDYTLHTGILIGNTTPSAVHVLPSGE